MTRPKATGRFTPLHEATNDEVLLARRMTRAGAEIEAIHAALGWQCDVKTTIKRLQRRGLKVRTRPSMKRAHFGDDTYLDARPNHQRKAPC